MIKTLNPNYPNNNTAKTAEIMSRYRPIAPKPDTNSSSSSITDNNGSSNSNNNNSLSQKIRNSPYLRSLWPQLQARPTRTRKRGRAPILTLPPSSLFKRQKIINNNNNNIVLGFCPPTTKNLISLQSLNFIPSHPHSHQHPHPHHQQLNNNNPLSNHAIGVLNCQLENTNNDVSTITTNSTTTSPILVTLPLLPCSPSSSSSSIHQPPKFDLTTNNNNNACKEVAFDLNLATKLNIPEEKDLLQQLQRPVAATAAATNNNNAVVVAPQPVRPVGSTISVGCINEDATKIGIQDQNNLKRKQEVEDEVESETLPAIITDSKNRVRMVNSSYKELVGQPECPWLESMVTSIHHQCGSSSSSAASSTASSLPSPISTSSSPRSNKSRISGEVTLQVCDDSVKIPDSSSSNGFSCWVRIEWQQKSNEDHHERNKKTCVSAFCDVTKLRCEYRDYVLSWRFHTRTREASQSSCNNV